MATKIITKNSSTAGAVPLAADLVQGELAVNVTDKALYTENASGTVVKLNAPSIDDKNTGATKHVTIDSSGNFLVGTTQTDKGVLTVYNNAASFSSVQAFAYLKGTQVSDSGTPGLSIAKYANDSSGSQIFVRFLINNGSNGNGQIVGAGSGAAAFSSYSDARLKENIVDLPQQLSNIMALRPVEFDYKDGSGHQIGFIAQEMQEVYSDAVCVREPDEMLTITGWSKTEARLVKAIQEMKTIIDQQAERIEALEAK